MYKSNGRNEKSIQQDIESNEIIKKYRETGDERYKDEFFSKNERLVYHVAKGFKDKRLEADDFVSIASVGMVKAFEKFDLEKGVRFSTFSVRCMENEILMELRRLGKQKNQVSLEQAITTDKDGNNLSLMDKLESSSSNDIETYEMNEGINAILLNLMNELDERSQFILSNMLDYEGRVNQRDMAEQLGISQSYISRLMRDISTRAKQIASNMDLGYMSQFNSTYSKKKEPLSQGTTKECGPVETQEPVITYLMKERKDMTKDKIEIPKGTLRSQVEYLMDNHSELTRLEMAELLGKNVSSIYSYVHDIKKSRERLANKKQSKSTPKPEQEKESVPDIPDKQEELAEEIFEKSKTSEKLEPVLSEPTVIEWVELKPAIKGPNTIDFSLTGVSGENLQTLLFNLLGNSVSADSEYSFVLRLEKTK